MRLFGFLVVFLLISCQQKQDTNTEKIEDIYQSDFKTIIKYAKGFEFIQKDSVAVLLIKSLSSKYPFEDSLVLKKYPSQHKAKYWRANWKKLACQSTTHITFLNALGSLQKVVGLSDISFMPKDSIYDKIVNSGVVELNQNNKVNMERLVSLGVDLFLMYPFELESDQYTRANVKTLLVSEYLEQTPIARLEWIKFFGILIGEEKKADSIFNHINANYSRLKSEKKLNKTFFFNLPFKDVWDMPASNSQSVNLVKDAGLTYLYDNHSFGLDNMSFSKESVWNKAYKADYWIIIANRPETYSLSDLIEEEGVYKTFNSVKNNQVIFCNTGYSSYFTQGILEPDIMLKDILFLTHQMTDHQPKYFQLLK